MSCGQELAVREFAFSYRRAAIIQVSLALVGLVLGLAAAWQLPDAWIATGAVLLVASILFTLAFILRTNKRLLDPLFDLQSVRVAELLARPNRVHAVQTVLRAAAFALLLRCLAGFHGTTW
jgi:hypothetical protein